MNGKFQEVTFNLLEAIGFVRREIDDYINCLIPVYPAGGCSYLVWA